MTGLPSPDAPPTTPRAGGEKELLAAQLDDKRTILLRKCAGLSEEDLRRAPTASSLSLLGILKHTAYTHQWWFRTVFAGEDLSFAWADDDPEFDLRPEPDETAVGIAALFQDECELARQIVAASDLDDPARGTHPRVKDINLRGVILHMLQEMSRHLGQADIIRETIDGATGD